MFDPKIKKAFEEYEMLKLRIKKYETEMEPLKEIIIDNFPEGKDVEGNYGVFSVQQKATWKYSPITKERRKELKEAEKEEQAKGIAEVSYVPILYYRTEKETEK